MKLKELRSKKYVALIMMIVIIGAIVGILKIGNMDFDKGKVKVSKAVINNVTSSLSANINEVAVDNLITSKGYDEIDYVIKYSLSTDENIKERNVIIEASLDDNEKYASFKDITNGDVISTVSENRKNIKITVKNAKVNKENELKLVMKLEGAPNGYKVTPKIKIKEVSEEMDDDIKRYVNDITYKNELLDTPTFKLDGEKTDMNAILATIGTGAILGATSGGVISIYSATLGNYAASLTLGAAIMTYLPPLLIAGTISGAVGKVIYDKVLDDRKNKEILDNIEKFIKNLKDNIKERLNKDYEKLSQEIVVTTTEILKNIKGVYINKYEIEDFMESIEKYITYLTQYVEISYNKA